MASLTASAVLLPPASETAWHPWGLPACAVLSDGTFMVAQAILSPDEQDSLIRVFHLSGELAALGTLDIPWDSASLAYPFVCATEDRTVMLVESPETSGNPGLVRMIDCSAADPVIRYTSATAYPPIGGTAGWPVARIYLREHAIVVFIASRYVTTYRHGVHLSALDISGIWNEVVGVWPNPTDPLKFSVDFLGNWQNNYSLRTYEFTVTPAGDITTAAMTVATYAANWPQGASSPYEDPSVVLDAEDGVRYWLRNRDGTVLATLPMTDLYLVNTAVPVPYVLGLSDARKILVAFSDWPGGAGGENQGTTVIEADFGDLSIAPTRLPQIVNPPVSNWQITNAGSTAIDHRDGRVIVAGQYVDPGTPNYFVLVAHAFDGGVMYPFRVKDEAGVWRVIGDGQKAGGGRLMLHDGQRLLGEQVSAEGESRLYPLKLKTADDRWETVAMLTKGEAV